MAFSPGDVVLVPFPYRDRLAEKTRPAVVLSEPNFNSRGDLILAAVTSHAPRETSDVSLADWTSAGLQLPSTVRMLLATLCSGRVVLQIGRLSSGDLAKVQAVVASILSIPSSAQSSSTP